jgi:integrase
MSHNTEWRKQRIYATLHVPEDVREIIGKSKFFQTTGTSDKKKACLIASQLVAGWKVLIQQARNQDPSKLIEAIKFREDIQNARDADERETLEHVLIDRATSIAKDDERAGKQFFDTGMGHTTPTHLHFASWKTQLHHVDKTRDQMERDVSDFIKIFPTTKDIHFNKLRDWLEKLEAEGKTYSHRQRVRGSAKDFWKYLVTRKVIADHTDVFTDTLPPQRGKKNARQTNWLPYTTDEVVAFWHKAREADKHELADLIALGAYTGARREELGKLKLENVGETSFHIVDSKTVSGIREVPIHSAIAPLMKRLISESTDGFLLSGLSATKYDARTNALATAFGRMKTAMGFGERHSYHSFRSTVITQLENAGVAENLAADIVGHDKPRITYGLYSKGNKLEIMREALEKVSYPFPELK